MSEAFLKVVNMSISAGWLVLAILALRLILKKAPKWVNVLLWGIVAVRLICPFSIESALSLIPSTETISPEIMMDWTPEISTGIAPLDRVVNPVISTSFAPQGMASANPLQILIPVAANLWLLGVLILLAYTAISYLSLRSKLRTAVILRDNIFQCETVSSPFVLGILKPRIYLPYNMNGQNLHHVVAHEQAHIRRKDHWWKPLGFLLLTVYWFNPLMWVAYILLCRDIELACDEKVIAELGNEQRADYTQALVSCAVNRRMIAACPLAFGEVGVKDRIKSIMNYRKPTFWIIVTALVVCVVVAVCFLTDPNPSREFSMNGNNVSGLDPEAIVERILDIEDITNSGVHVNTLNFSLQVDSNFNWADSQAIRYFYKKNHNTHSGQLRIFPDEDRYFLTEPSEWPEQQEIFLLRHYLEAIKYLPQYEIKKMAPADQYIIQHVADGRPSDYERVITYTENGVKEIDGWYIHLQIQPLHADGEGYHGIGDEIIEVFYGHTIEESLANTKIVIRNLHNGKNTTISDSDAVKSIVEFLNTVGGANPTSSKGYYGGSYQIQAFKGSEEIFSIGFGDDESFNYGDYGDGYPTRYDLRGVTREEVIRFFSQFDSSGFDWGLYEFSGVRNLGLNAEIIEIDSANRILYVKDIDKQAKVFGDRCAIDCGYAISRYNLCYVNYGDPNDVRTIDFSTFEVGDAIIIGMYDSEKEKAFNGSAIAEQVQLSTQRVISDLAFEFNFAGNTSGGQRMELTEEQPYWCITIANEGVNGITIDVAGDIYYVDAGTTGNIYSDKAWNPGTYAVSFGTAGGNGMEGYAICRISATPFPEEEPRARKLTDFNHPLVAYISSDWAPHSNADNIDLPFDKLLVRDDGSCNIDGMESEWRICDEYTSKQSIHIEIDADAECIISVVYWKDSQLLQIVDENGNLLDCYYHRIAYPTA